MKSVKEHQDIAFPAKGYPLKRNNFWKWIKEQEYTVSFVANRLNLPAKVFKRKLWTRQMFNREQIWALIQLMGAEDAFRVIYLPTVQIREKVWWEVFGQYEREAELHG